MHGDFSRSTFSERHAYRAVLLQQGRVVLDADFNEQADLTAHHDETRTLDVVGQVGGPLPATPTAPGPFAIRTADGSKPAGVPWTDLVVTPGRYYVDGVLAESFPPQNGAGWPLEAQPFGKTPEPPSGSTRYALYLEVTDHDVTGDAVPKLLESALGGPDTSIRRQTTWRVRCEKLADDVQCSDLNASWLAREPRAMVAGVREPAASSDPCRIVASGGYRRLENQLYRVQVHEVNDDGTATYLWSRENGSVVAQVRDMVTSPDATSATLTIDRTGRDEELSIISTSWIELTNTDRQLLRLPGFLGTVTRQTGLELEVTWSGALPPARLDELGAIPIIRRWESGPRNLTDAATELEDGITVRFPAGGQPRTGDYWQIPARAVQLAYGLGDTRGTIEWPPPGVSGDAARPMGPATRIAPLAIVSRAVVEDQALWTLDSDCRRLFPPQTELIGLDLVGGDGQESLPGSWLDEPVRVVVRSGSRPVPDAQVRFTAADSQSPTPYTGQLSTDTPPVAAGSALDVITGADGVAAVRWQLDSGGPVTQVLAAQRLDDGEVTDVQVRATARQSMASEVAFTREGCEVFDAVATVKDALDRLAGHVELRLQGGDGQQVLPDRPVLQQPVRVIADSPCGPVQGVMVRATATEGAHVRVATEGEQTPDDLSGDPDQVEITTGPDGSALFWWQPGGRRRPLSDTLELRRPDHGPRAPIVVSAQWELVGEGGAPSTPGAHIEGVFFRSGNDFTNDNSIVAGDLATGVVFVLDQEVLGEMTGKPMLRIELDLPWPVPGDGDPWSNDLVGTRTVTLDGYVHAEGSALHWTPSGSTQSWLLPDGGLWSVGEVWKREGVQGRAVLEGWAVRTAEDQAVNTHAELVLDGGRLLYRLPTDDLVPGGTFTQWFRLQPGDVDRREVPDFIGMETDDAVRQAKEWGFNRIVVKPSHQPGVVVRQRPRPQEPANSATLLILGIEGER